MLTVYIHDEADSLRFKLLGELDDAGAAEFGQSWKTASSTLRGRAVVVDLSEVRKIGEEGSDVLRQLARNRASFITASLPAETLVRDISGREPHLEATPRMNIARRLWCHVVRCYRQAAGERVRKFW